MSGLLFCRECSEGKHRNCDSTAWSNELDAPAPCTCPDPSHAKAEPTAEKNATGPGWFWTQAEWAEWSDTLASLLPEEYHDDVAQEAIIERALQDLVTMVEDARAILGEYEDAGSLPAPYTNERALYERISSALGRESRDIPPGAGS